MSCRLVKVASPAPSHAASPAGDLTWSSDLGRPLLPSSSGPWALSLCGPGSLASLPACQCPLLLPPGLLDGCPLSWGARWGLRPWLPLAGTAVSLPPAGGLFSAACQGTGPPAPPPAPLPQFWVCSWFTLPCGNSEAGRCAKSVHCGHLCTGSGHPAGTAGAPSLAFSLGLRKASAGAWPGAAQGGYHYPQVRGRGETAGRRERPETARLRKEAPHSMGPAHSPPLPAQCPSPHTRGPGKQHREPSPGKVPGREAAPRHGTC